MLTAIQLDDEFPFDRDEIDNMVADGVLSAKAYAVEFVSPQNGPKFSFRGCRLSAQFACAMHGFGV
ncbi:MAG: hypothetical protein QY332_19455 [Anaerolineales bacterium]|nr:MAG: hypothetical protein QY332_19455 [Anaerolineales bacterium]